MAKQKNCTFTLKNHKPKTMKSNYHEKREARINSFLSLANKNKDLSISAYSQAESLGKMIPMGQPILVGHHSERSHRAHIGKIDNAMRKSVELNQKAKHYVEKAAAAENNTAISSDNPEAIELLEQKLEKLIKKQELFKACNKLAKNNKLTLAEKIEHLEKLGISSKTAIEFLQPDYAGRVGVPSFYLSNNNANIRSTKERIERLKKVEAMQSTEEVINGVTVAVSVEDNRVQLFFGHKPNEATRQSLKSNGFRFCYSNEAWQRQISGHAIRVARQIANSYTDVK